jgi:hypothetical protein
VCIFYSYTRAKLLCIFTRILYQAIILRGVFCTWAGFLCRWKVSIYGFFYACTWCLCLKVIWRVDFLIGFWSSFWDKKKYWTRHPRKTRVNTGLDTQGNLEKILD